MEKPEFVTDEHLDYLEMFILNAAEYLPCNFPELSKQDAREVLKYWLTIKKEEEARWKSQNS